MRNALLRVPAVLAALVLAAHFFRNEHPFAMVLCLLVPVLFFLPGRAALAAARVLLAAGALEWVRTAVAIGHARVARGEPYVRMAAILGGVALFTLLAAWLLPAAREPGRPRA